jgi:hypothetical protein
VTPLILSNPDKAVADLIEFNRYGKDSFAGTAWQTEGWQVLGEVANDSSYAHVERRIA